MSFLPQRVSFPESLTGREVVEFYRRLREAPAGSAERVLEFASLNGAGARAVGTYSGGMVQRLGLAVATLAPTEVLLLDEPTAALDPEGLRAFYELVEARRKAGGTVFFSSHQLGDVERLADHVAVIVSGTLVAVLTEHELAARLADRGLMRVRLAARPEGCSSACANAHPGPSGGATSWWCPARRRCARPCSTSSERPAPRFAASPRKKAASTRSTRNL